MWFSSWHTAPRKLRAHGFGNKTRNISIYRLYTWTKVIRTWCLQIGYVCHIDVEIMLIHLLFRPCAQVAFLLRLGLEEASGPASPVSSVSAGCLVFLLREPFGLADGWPFVFDLPLLFPLPVLDLAVAPLERGFFFEPPPFEAPFELPSNFNSLDSCLHAWNGGSYIEMNIERAWSFSCYIVDQYIFVQHIMVDPCTCIHA